MNKERTSEKGFTLVEMMITLVLLPIVAMAVFVLFDVSTEIFNQTNTYSRLNNAGMQALRTITRELGQTSPLVSPSHLTIGVGTAGTSIVTFQIPVDWDNDGDVVTAAANPQTEWGAYTDVGQTSSGDLGGWIRYRVVANGTEQQLVRETLNAAQTTILSSKILVTDVQSFSVSRTSNMATISMTARCLDPISGRTLTAAYGHDIVLRNQVN